MLWLNNDYGSVVCAGFIFHHFILPLIVLLPFSLLLCHCALQLVDRVFDESLNFRKIPPMVQTKAPEINGRSVELRPRAPDSQDPQTALRRRTWNRDEVRPV